MKQKSKKIQIETSLKQFITDNKQKYNGIIPLNDLEYEINGDAYVYQSPYSSPFYEDRIAKAYIRNNYTITTVSNLSFEEQMNLTRKMHGNLQVFLTTKN